MQNEQCMGIVVLEQQTQDNENPISQGLSKNQLLQNEQSMGAVMVEQYTQVGTSQT